MFSKRIAVLLKKKQKMLELTAEVIAEDNALSNEIKLAVNHEFKLVYPDIELTAYASFNTDDHAYHVYKANNCNIINDKFYDYKYDEQKLCVSVNDIKTVLNSISKKLGLKIILHTEIPAMLRKIPNGLKLVYPGIEILTDGYVTHKGCDYVSKWCISRLDNKYKIFWENNLGLLTDHVVDEQDKIGIEEFFKFLSEDDENDYVHKGWYAKLICGYNEIK